ncbi:MAG: esterase-like activity of phytase family protein [Bryobacteraceae bacterium]
MEFYKTKIHQLVIGLAVGACGLMAQTGTLANTYTLPDTPMGAFQNSVFPGSIPDDHGFLLGAIGSGLFRSFLEGSNVYWMVTDRGPNPFNPANQRTFPLEGFTPWLIKVRTTGSSIEILQKIPITLPSGAPATGLPNTSPRDEAVRQCDGVTISPQNQNGLDTEDLVRTLDGNFWLVDEHSPSIVKVLPNGTVSKRFLPAGLILTTDYPTVNNIPQIFGVKRKQNRGFEGITLGWDLRTLYAALQSPLVNPTAAIGNASRNTRILAMDAYNEQMKAEYVYRFQPVTEFGNTNPTEMKVSAVAALDPWRLLVLERTDLVAKIYRVDLTKATNILGTKWDDVATSPSLEALDDAGLTAENLKVLPKELIIDLSTIPGIPGKIEGMAILDHNTIAISNDNDFAVGPATCGANVGPGTKNHILVINLTKSLYF